MNELIEKQNKPTISSLEVSEMMGINHKEMLRKLEGGKDRKGYVSVLTEHQMAPSDYFIEDAYRDESGKLNKCYQFTKMGCEFIANKFTGEKGILFTAKYVKRFNEMENSTFAPRMSKELAAILMIDQKQQIIETRVESLENNMTVDYGQQRNLSNAANSTVVKTIGGVKQQAYKDNSIRSKVFSSIWKGYKDYFNINSYCNTPRIDYQKGIDFLMNWRPDGKLLRDIEDCNNQIALTA